MSLEKLNKAYSCCDKEVFCKAADTSIQFDWICQFSGKNDTVLKYFSTEGTFSVTVSWFRWSAAERLLLPLNYIHKLLSPSAGRQLDSPLNLYFPLATLAVTIIQGMSMNYFTEMVLVCEAGRPSRSSGSFSCSTKKSAPICWNSPPEEKISV